VRRRFARLRGAFRGPEGKLAVACVNPRPWQDSASQVLSHAGQPPKPG